MSGLIWIQTAWHSNGISEKNFWKCWFWKKISRQQKSMKNNPVLKELMSQTQDHEFNPFNRNGISHSYRLDQSIFFLSVVCWYFLCLFKFSFCKQTMNAFCAIKSRYALFVYLSMAHKKDARAWEKPPPPPKKKKWGQNDLGKKMMDLTSKLGEITVTTKNITREQNISPKSSYFRLYYAKQSV